MKLTIQTQCNGASECGMLNYTNLTIGVPDVGEIQKHLNFGNSTGVGSHNFRDNHFGFIDVKAMIISSYSNGGKHTAPQGSG